jgi:hypothetical protein
VRAIQHTQFCAKNAKNDLNPTNLVKRNFCFETEGVQSIHGATQTLFWELLNVVMAENGVPKVNFKGFMSDNGQAN